VYFSASDPPLGWVIATQCLVAAAVAASLFRVRARRAAVAQVLLAWSLPLVFVLLCSLLLVVGRFAEFGYLSAQVITYAFGAAVPCALAVFLAFTRPTAAPDAAAGRRRRPRATRRAGPALATLVALQLAAAAVSELRFTHRWAENPTERYVSALRAGLDRHPGAALFDTPLPLDVLPFTEPDRYLSDVVPLLGRNPSFTAHSGAMIVDAKGRLRPATFLPAAAVRKGPPGTFCDNLLSGVRSGRYGLDRVPQPNEWFLDLDYFQQHPSVVHVWLVDARGHRTAPVGGDRVVLAGTLDRAYLRFPSVRPVAVVIESRSADTNTCFANLQVGYPFPRKAGS
jgi:hypothetical protein